MSATFVDHLQLLPMPHRGRHRQPDGDHRPGGLGMAGVADALGERGWTPRHEDIGIDRDLPELRLAESYARSLADAVDSAWDRNRFPVLLLRSSWGSLGPIDALGARTGVVWVDARGRYGRRSFLSRPAIDHCALSLVTGRARRDPFAVRPARLDGRQIVILGGQGMESAERRALAVDGVRVAESPADLEAALSGMSGDPWYLHVDLGALRADLAPAADEPSPAGLDASELTAALGEAFRERPLRAAAFAGYDLNRDQDGRTLATLVDLIEAAVVAAGGIPDPERAAGAAT